MGMIKELFSELMRGVSADVDQKLEVRSLVARARAWEAKDNLSAAAELYLEAGDPMKAGELYRNKAQNQSDAFHFRQAARAFRVARAHALQEEMYVKALLLEDILDEQDLKELTDDDLQGICRALVEAVKAAGGTGRGVRGDRGAGWLMSTFMRTAEPSRAVVIWQWFRPMDSHLDRQVRDEIRFIAVGGRTSDGEPRRALEVFQHFRRAGAFSNDDIKWIADRFSAVGADAEAERILAHH